MNGTVKFIFSSSLSLPVLDSLCWSLASNMGPSVLGHHGAIQLDHHQGGDA